MSRPRQCVVVFAKSPRLGAVKTRLVPPLTRRQALDLYRACLVGTLRVVLSLPPRITKAVYWTGAPAKDFPRSWRRQLEFRRQRGAILGQRMSNALADLLAKGFDRVVIVGGDHPTVPRARILQAFAKLGRSDVVLGPSLDGGYYLVGCRRWIPEMFQKIPWGTSRVFRATRARLRRLHVPVAILPAWYDVDRPQDLRRLRRDLARVPRDSNYPRELDEFVKRLEGKIRQSSRRPQPARPDRRRQPGRA